jgi:hypothetical protein
VVHRELASRLENSGSGVRYHDIEPPPPFIVDGRKDAFDMVWIRNVALEDKRPDATSLDLLRSLFGTGSIAKVIDSNVDLKIGQREGNRPSDAARGAGHQGTPAAEFEIHLHLQGHKLTREWPENKRRRGFSGDIPLTVRG